MPALQTLHIFKQATGLTLNHDKTQTLALQPPHPSLHSLNLNITTQSIAPLNIPLGNKDVIHNKWKAATQKLKDKAKEINHQHATFDSKSILTKTILSPQITYLASTYPLTNHFRIKINETLSNFFSKPSLPAHELVAPKNSGGYNAADINLYSDLYYIKPITQYVHHRTHDTSLPPHLQLLEYHIGTHISRQYNFSINNSIPHATSISPYYKHTLDLLQEYDLPIHIIFTTTIKPKYNYIQSKTYRDTNPTTQADVMTAHPNHTWIHHPALPNHIKTFNYKTTHNLLPIKSNLMHNNPDQNPNCPLCNKRFENNYHLFHYCHQIQTLLHFTTDLYTHITNNSTDFFLSPNRFQFQPTTIDQMHDTLIPILNLSLIHI